MSSKNSISLIILFNQSVTDASALANAEASVSENQFSLKENASAV